MTESRRVVVTGLGVISAIGSSCSEFWRSIVAGRAGIGPIEGVDVGRVRFKNGAEVQGFVPEDHLDPGEIDVLDRFAQFATVAAREACRDAGVEWTPELGDRTAVVTGTCVAGQRCVDGASVELYANGRSRINPYTVPRVMANSGASQISMDFGIRGPVFTVSTACSSSNHAIGHAAWLVRHGMADLAVAGGSEAPFTYGHLKAWEAMRVVAHDTCRPFSKDRQGLILGEGAGMLVIEPMESARARGARMYGEIVGFGMSSDAHHVTQPSPEGAAKAMDAALKDACLSPDRIGYINAHGTGTPRNDAVETAAIRLSFGPHAERLAVSSTKSMHGHALGAASAMEAVATLLGLHHGVLPPTANHRVADPECDLDIVKDEPREVAVDFALSNSFAFGGLNAVLVFGRV